MTEHCVLLLLIFASFVTAVAENKCASANGVFYYATSSGLINKVNFVDGKREQKLDYSISTNTANIQSIAYDYQHDRVLFVSGNNLDTIWSVGRLVKAHPFVQLANASFNSIVADPLTNNIYFTSNNVGIGVCSEQNCTLLIEAPDDVPTTYKSLTIYWQRGSLYWVEAQGERSTVKMASMSGKNVRELTQFPGAKSLALNAQFDQLYIASEVGPIKVLSLNVNSTGEAGESSANAILYLNCKLYIIEKNYNKQNFYTGQEKLVIEKPPNAYPVIRIYTNLEQIASVFVMESDQAQKSNPCKTSKCYGTCVLAEGFLQEPTAECVGFNNVYKEFSHKRTNNQYIALLIGGLILLILLVLLGYILFLKRNRILQIVDTQSAESVEDPSSTNSARSVVVTEL